MLVTIYGTAVVGSGLAILVTQRWRLLGSARDSFTATWCGSRLQPWQSLVLNSATSPNSESPKPIEDMMQVKIVGPGR